MTYRNDPYDPKQVALLDPEALSRAVAEAEKAFAETRDLDDLAAVKHLHLGDRAPVSLARREIGALPPAAKADAGKNVNQARVAVQAAFDARREALEAERAARVLREEAVDVTLPAGRRPQGARHPLTLLSEQVEDLFLGMGYEIAEGPEVESAWYNFDALNMGPDHPARQMMDTFYLETAKRQVSKDLVLRTHTSPVQIRTMLTKKPPIYVVCPGRVYRTDELDATHTPVFMQVEGLVIDKGITMSHMRGVLEHFARVMIGEDIVTRLRPSYFPFTEPSAELDLWWPLHRDGPRWIEWGGCGMVNPRVLRACGVDPDEYTGFAFGMGIERTLMLRSGVTDMRHMVEGDVRFARAYGTEV
ncbi:phenylalanine--tRNA ligase alpha subunit [Actinorhabdospora filicis]|uniref:Phenylalanine--tRNA ligase alpha subunit n=1 Tax=Actinorhabdospora filicis TaxID=1785913 RepID=A0A9W6SG26_9ACTN|nr:phenylalanine--tRNA ligase subunit alpha [Actinorhabdospora filicis]GLZ75227.1 phenylalanine--tRNA ligase alpha subunit [Actinorhabdospora filicis]